MLRFTIFIAFIVLLVMACHGATITQVTKAQSGTSVALATGDTLEVALPADHTAGYNWQITAGNDNLLKSLGAPEYSAPLGRYTFRFLAVAPGTVHLTLVFRPQNRSGPVTAHFNLTVKITGQPLSPRITLQSGQIGVARGKVPVNTTDRWVVSLRAGQTLRVALAPLLDGQAILIIFGIDGTVLISDHAETSYFEGVIPVTQDYNIDIRPMANTSPEYRLLVTVTP